jgi:hypothetical protein
MIRRRPDPVRSRRLPLVVLALLCLGATVGAVLTGPPVGSATTSPTVRLMASEKAVTITRYGDNPAVLELGTFIGAVNGPFEIRVGRAGDAFEAIQGVSSPDGSFRFVRRLPPGSVRNIEQGIADFFEITVNDASGRRVRRDLVPFCPGGFEHSRLDDSGPDTPRYPRACPATSQTQKTVWGLDRGWAVAVPREHIVDIHEGVYDVTIAITSKYRRLFGVDPQASQAKVRVTVRTEELPEEGARDVGSGWGSDADHHHAAPDAPTVAAGARGLPDLIALPAWNLTARVDEQTGRDQLDFAATIWNGGEGPLVVEGFRRPGADLMEAFQYFYDNGRRVGREQVGTFEFDRRDGHDHWHFTDFARYRLLDRSKNVVVRSQKEAFCLAATDPVDLTLPTAQWAPDATDLHTACGRAESIWIREVLDVGWGDTYIQTLPGQSFDITDVPNGIYLVEVTTNPERNLKERSTANNTAHLTVELGGRRGARTVTPR